MRRGIVFSQPDLAVRLLVGGLLLTTALLKAWSPAETAVLQTAYDVPRWAFVAVVQVELALAAALISGVWPRATRLAAMGLFGIFALFSLYRALSGAESCGCFGSIKVNPWWTFLLDLGVLTLLGLFPLRATCYARPRLRSALAAASYAALGLAAFQSMHSSSGPSEPASGLSQAGGLTILEPEEWIDDAFPLASHIRPRAPLSNGDWTVVLYHHDCPKCQAAKPRYEELADAHAPARVLLVEVPPYGPDPAATNKPGIYARLSDDRQWFVQAPVEIRLNGGVVTDASLELPSIAAIPE